MFPRFFKLTLTLLLISLTWLIQRVVLIRGNDFWKVAYAHTCKLNLLDSQGLDLCGWPPARQDLRRDGEGYRLEQEAWPALDGESRRPETS